MKKSKKKNVGFYFGNFLALLCGVAAFLLGLAPALVGQAEATGIIKSDKVSKTFYELMKGDNFSEGIAIIVLLSVGLAFVLCCCALVYLKHKKGAKLLCLLNGLVFLAAGVLFFCINAISGGSSSADLWFTTVKYTTSLGYGAIVSGIVCAFATLCEIYTGLKL